ncbi:FAD:protein FMN transferase [Oryzibacter oryziterrae]|uniref:FAD:protein FMN transferase n=1 Tax=Oryzibacter oryziterrae TaxID=2766474 RepID=UPI001F3F0A88|nr:FAD:protein FMN transferase [Oryzibacter oryziterrae]
MEEFAFVAMGTECSITLADSDPGIAIEAAGAATAEIERIEAKFTRYDPRSLISEINNVAAKGGDIALDPETTFLLDFAFMAHSASDGLFDITSGALRRAWGHMDQGLPQPEALDDIIRLIGLNKLKWRPPVLSFPIAGMEIDFGGLAKEYAADRAAKICRQAGAQAGLVNLGGDIAVFGNRHDEMPWPVAIRNPFGGDEPAGTLGLRIGGIATSGDTERALVVDGKRYSHIFDPRTGWPVEGLRSVSVRTDSTLLAGALSTIAMLKGPQGVEWLRMRNCEFLAIDHDGNKWGNLAAI